MKRKFVFVCLFSSLLLHFFFPVFSFFPVVEISFFFLFLFFLFF